MIFFETMDLKPNTYDSFGFDYPEGLCHHKLSDVRVVIIRSEGAAALAPIFADFDANGSGNVGSAARFWISQGVVLLSIDNEHFVSELIRRFVSLRSETQSPLAFILWGDDAQSLASCIPSSCTSCTLFSWTGLPSSVRGRSLGFAEVNERLLERASERGRSDDNFSPITWSPLEHSIAFTDGGCVRNGQPDATASFAVYIAQGVLAGAELSGRVQPHAYGFIDDKNPAKGFAPIASTHMTPTNNRGEYLAWCWVLLLFVRIATRGHLRIVSDCNLFIRTMLTWLPARRLKGTAHKLKNFDLICIAETLVGLLRARSCLGSKAILFEHTHQKRPPLSASDDAHLVWSGNDRVDGLASAVLCPDWLVQNSSVICLNGICPALAWSVFNRYESTGRQMSVPV